MKTLLFVLVIFAGCLALSILFNLLLRKQIKTLEEDAEQLKREILTLRSQLDIKEIESQAKKEVEENVKKETQKLHKGSSSDRFNAASNILRND
ncbi:MAG: hypothetical protein KBT02_00245 [Treponema sp.]|nr:hypothetical protein [Candidatus Treponema caballi]